MCVIDFPSSIRDKKETRRNPLVTKNKREYIFTRSNKYTLVWILTQSRWYIYKCNNVHSHSKDLHTRDLYLRQVAKNVSNKKIFYIIPSYQKYFIFHRIIIINKYLIEYYLHNLKLLEKIIIFTCVTNITNIICIT